MQGDGNFVVVNGDGTPLCASHTEGNDGAYLRLRDDGVAVIYSPAGEELRASPGSDPICAP
jgi:hypothetical protein